MKNKITDLHNHMFAALERLNDTDLTPEQLETEIKRAQAVANVGKVVVDGYKTQVMALKELNKNGIVRESELNESVKALIEKPKAEYSNKDHLQLRKAE
jgi:UTP-glucose-1-phosphate uridylyltransferase